MSECVYIDLYNSLSYVYRLIKNGLKFFEVKIILVDKFNPIWIFNQVFFSRHFRSRYFQQMKEKLKKLKSNNKISKFFFGVNKFSDFFF